MDWSDFGTCLAQAAIVVVFVGFVYLIGTALVDAVRNGRRR